MRLERRPRRARRLQCAQRAPRRWAVRRVQTCLGAESEAGEAGSGRTDDFSKIAEKLRFLLHLDFATFQFPSCSLDLNDVIDGHASASEAFADHHHSVRHFRDGTCAALLWHPPECCCRRCRFVATRVCDCVIAVIIDRVRLLTLFQQVTM